MNDNEEIVAKYLLSCADSAIASAYDKKYAFNDVCAKNINEAFGTAIKEDQYGYVVNGNGNEKDKINKAYSSSLQSLLFFSAVNAKNPITINKIDYTQALFEFKNRVIKSPSCIDVVLIDKDYKNFVFIESKLTEIPRDSNEDGTPVIGRSYFNDSCSAGYKKALDLAQSDLNGIGIFIEDATETSKHLRRVHKIKDYKYVYSYGIKQILSHLIGISNFKYNRKDSTEGRLSEELDCKDIKITYMELYNAFPKIGNKEIETKIDNFKEHCNAVRTLIMRKEPKVVNNFLVMSYQDLYKNRGDYKISDKVVSFYHLGE